jgi:hypothetical protein
MNRQEKRVIDLYEFDGLGLILKCPSGVCYTHQTAGFACLHPRIEGVFYPLPAQPGKKALFTLAQHFRGAWNHIEKKDADFVDRILRRNRHPYLSVDRSYLEDSFEAWIHVKLGEAPDELSGFSGRKAVLIWPNSD